MNIRICPKLLNDIFIDYEVELLVEYSRGCYRLANQVASRLLGKQLGYKVVP